VVTTHEELSEQIVEMDVLNALRKGPLTFDQIQARTRILPGPLAITLAKLFMPKQLKVQSDSKVIVYMLAGNPEFRPVSQAGD
jgi:DNA-binding HxlR family transcriptional regulator